MRDCGLSEAYRRLRGEPEPDGLLGRGETELVDRAPGSPTRSTARSRSFGPFFTTREVGEGTGQGLALAYSWIVNRRGGSIDVVSAPGEGAVFMVTLRRTAATTDDGETVPGGSGR